MLQHSSAIRAVRMQTNGVSMKYILVILMSVGLLFSSLVSEAYDDEQCCYNKCHEITRVVDDIGKSEIKEDGCLRGCIYRGEPVNNSCSKGNVCTQKFLKYFECDKIKSLCTQGYYMGNNICF